MKIKILCFLLFCSIFTELWAAGKHFSFRCPQKIIQGKYIYYENRLHTYFFSMDIVADWEGTKKEYKKHGYPFIQAVAEQRYSVRIHNPMPVRVAVNLMIDGLNSISGNPSSPESGTKWIIEPHSSILIKGWQVNENSARRFYFTRIEDSYAQWQSYRLEQNLTLKCGRISAAYFWNRQELKQYYEKHPLYKTPVSSPIVPYRGREEYSGKYKSSSKMHSQEKENRAGTGMGQRDSHPVESVEFIYDMGMYEEKDMLTLFYDFGYQKPSYRSNRQYPQKYFEQEFAPEKP